MTITATIADHDSESVIPFPNVRLWDWLERSVSRLGSTGANPDLLSPAERSETALRRRE